MVQTLMHLVRHARYKAFCFRLVASRAACTVLEGQCLMIGFSARRRRCWDTISQHCPRQSGLAGLWHMVSTQGQVFLAELSDMAHQTAI
jgi:hypothetical protein